MDLSYHHFHTQSNITTPQALEPYFWGVIVFNSLIKHDFLTDCLVGQPRPFQGDAKLYFAVIIHSGSL